MTKKPRRKRRHDYRVVKTKHGRTLTRGSEIKDRRATAVHEAGHAVVAHLLLQRVTRIELHQDNLHRGFTHIEYFMRRVGPRGGSLKDPVILLMTIIAGHEAEHAIYGRPLEHLPSGDLLDALHTGCTVLSLNRIGYLTRVLIRMNEAKIRRVARALYKKGKLSRPEFLRALRTSAS